MTVATTPPPESLPASNQVRAISAMIWSPSTTVPFSSTMTTRSASPSSAMPMSARTSWTFLERLAGWVEPQSSLMLKPLGSSWMAITSAPSSQSAAGATL